MLIRLPAWGRPPHPKVSGSTHSCYRRPSSLHSFSNSVVYYSKRIVQWEIWAWELTPIFCVDVRLTDSPCSASGLWSEIGSSSSAATWKILARRSAVWTKELSWSAHRSRSVRVVPPSPPSIEMCCYHRGKLCAANTMLGVRPSLAWCAPWPYWWTESWKTRTIGCSRVIPELIPVPKSAAVHPRMDPGTYSRRTELNVWWSLYRTSSTQLSCSLVFV